MAEAILGDIHANREGLDAVLADIDARNSVLPDDRKIKRFICTGDIVGYGPDPVYCLWTLYELSRRGLLISAGGNHDYAVHLKLEDPNAPIGASIGIKGEGGYEGVHLAARQLSCSSKPIPLAERPVEPPANCDEKVREAYRAALREWKDKLVEPDTKSAIERFKSGKYVNGVMASLANGAVNSQVGVSARQRLGSSADIASSVQRQVVEQSSLTELEARSYNESELAQYQRNGLLQAFLGFLKAEERISVERPGLSPLSVLVVHDNPFEPGNTMYMVDRAGRERLGLTRALKVEDALSQWDAKWANDQVICFGHSHLPGVYPDAQGRLLINPGSVGMPRADAVEATYAIWNPEVQGPESVEIVHLKHIYSRITSHKMRMRGLPDKFAHVHDEVAA